MIKLKINLDNNLQNPQSNEKHILKTLRGVRKVQNDNYGLEGKCTITFDDSIIQAVLIVNDYDKLRFTWSTETNGVTTCRAVLDNHVLATINPKYEEGCKEIKKLTELYRYGSMPKSLA